MPLTAPNLAPFAEAISSAIDTGHTGVYINAEVNNDSQVRAVTRDYLRELQRLGAI